MSMSKKACNYGLGGTVLHTQLAPMWVLKVEDFLNFYGPPPTHQELMKRGLLVEKQPGFSVIFVSHQWLGDRHPDATGAQTEVLRVTLQNIIDGRTQVEISITDRFQGNSKYIPSRAEFKASYLWLDWFSVPQTWGEEREAELLPYIKSIPAFIESCDMLVALVPRLRKADGTLCDDSTWHSRGWCRTEMWCKLLLSAHSSHPVFVIYGKDSAQFATSLDWINFSVHEGDFRSEADREHCCEVVQRCLDFKLSRLASQPGSRDLFRYYAARYEDFVGLPEPKRTVSLFLAHFGFESLEAAIQQKTGMGAVACAAASGDVEMLRYFVEAGAPMITPITGGKLLEVDTQDGLNALHLATRRGRRCGPVLKELLKLRADPTTREGFRKLSSPALCYVYTAEAVDYLIQYRADVNVQFPPMNITPITAATLRGAPVEAIARLVEHRANVNLYKGGAGMPVLGGLGLLRTSPNAKQAAQLLLEARADVNLPFQTGGVFKALEWACRARRTFSCQEPSYVVRWFSDVTGGTTPLGVACFTGNEAMVEFLLSNRADPHFKNHRGLTPLQLARHSCTRAKIMEHMQGSRPFEPWTSPPVLKEAVQSEQEPCGHGLTYMHVDYKANHDDLDEPMISVPL